MRIKLFFLVSLITISAVLISCNKDKMDQPDNLAQYGILGVWKLEARLRNGITDLAIICCDTLILRPDSQIADLKGEFTSVGIGFETNGIFTLNPPDARLHFDYTNASESRIYQVVDNSLSLMYSEENDSIIENWRRIE
jgi:hypothetical protein